MSTMGMGAKRDNLVTIVLPAFNEAEGLPLVIPAIQKALAGCGVDLEIIVIDDGSTDATQAVVKSIREAERDVRYLRFSRNFGKEAAITAGLRAATGDAVIIMDSDGQHPAALLSKFIERWRAGVDVVAGVQEARAEAPTKRQLKRWYYWLMEAGGSVVIPPNAGDFRLMDRKVVDAINALPERNRLMKGIYAWVGFTTEFVTFQALPRVAGATKFGLARLFGLGFTGLTSFSIVPLRLVAVAGFLVSFISIVFGCYLLFEHYVLGDHLPGWATISVGMMFLSGLQLLALGVIAEYVGRTFEEAKQRPLYIMEYDSGARTRVVTGASAASTNNALIPSDAQKIETVTS